MPIYFYREVTRMQFRDDIVRGVRLAGFGFAGLLIFLAIHRTVNFVGTADAKQSPVSAPEPDPNAYLSMPAPVVPAPPVTEPAPAPAPARPPAHAAVRNDQAVPPPPPSAPKHKGSTEFAAKYVPPVKPAAIPETEPAAVLVEPPPPHISAESLASTTQPPPGKPAEDAAKLPPITPVFVVPPEPAKQGHGLGWIKAVGRALKPKKDDQ
jgi:hypothetical protein